MAVKTFSEAGKGRKKCPNCPNYVAAVTKKCPCGHEFVRGTKPKPAKKPDRIAAKLATAAATDTEPTQDDTVRPRGRGGIGVLRIATPAGACPAKLTGTDKQAVYAWIDRVLKAGEDDSRELLESAIKYYAREFYNITERKDDGLTDYQIVCQHIESYYRGDKSLAPSKDVFDDEPKLDVGPAPFLPSADIPPVDDEDDEDDFEWS